MWDAIQFPSIIFIYILGLYKSSICSAYINILTYATHIHVYVYMYYLPYLPDTNIYRDMLKDFILQMKGSIVVDLL